MTLATFLALTAGVQLLFLALDLVERRWMQATDRAADPLRTGSFLFLLAVIGAFFAVQVAGFAVVPRVDALLAWVRAAVGGTGSGVGDSATVPGWRTAMLLAVPLFYLAGLVDYVWHRWFSHHRLFWFTHESHHLPSEIFVGMPGLGVRPFAVLTVVPVVSVTAGVAYLGLRAGGLPMWSWTIFQLPLLLSSTLLVITHSSFMRRGWLAHRVMRPLALTSPQEHVLHHTVDLHGNFGNFTTLWDRVFGTYLDPLRPEHQGHRYGLPYDQDYLGTLTIGMLRIPAGWRARFQVGRYCNLDEPPADGAAPGMHS